MRNQDDLKAIAAFTSGIAKATGDVGATRADYHAEVAGAEISTSAQGRMAKQYKDVANMAIAAKADMARACAAMLQEVSAIDAAAKAATSKINEAAGKMAQSLQKTRDMMGPQVEERLKQIERMVDCLERFQSLESSGVAQRYFEAFKR